MQKSAKKVEIESKKDAKKDRKYPSSMEKIVDMPLIASTNLISVVQRNESANEIDEARESRVEGTTSSDAASSGKSERKNICRGQATKNNERAEQKTSQKSARIEYDFTKTGMKRGASEAISRMDDGTSDKGIELTLTPLAKNEAEDAAESDRSMMIGGGKEASKIGADEGGKAVAGKEERANPPGGRKMAEVEKKKKKKTFGFGESRESVGEPDGREDEKELTVEPPALPKSPPPPVETRPPPPTLLQAETFNKQPIVTEPRPSFLHGAINSEVKVKPLVPQKPTNFPAKSNSVDGNGKKNCAPPPSSPVQQDSGTARSDRNEGKHFPRN